MPILRGHMPSAGARAPAGQAHRIWQRRTLKTQHSCAQGFHLERVSSAVCGLLGSKRSKKRFCTTRVIALGASRERELETRLARFREVLANESLQAYIIPTDDAHMSEIPPDCFARRKFLTGFSGSAGTAVVTRHEAMLWTDGRYFLQAKMELSSSWELMKSGLKDTPDLGEWLCKNLQKGDLVGIDPTVHAALPTVELQKQLQKVGVELHSLQPNLVDQIWQTDRNRPNGQIRIHPQSLAGSCTLEKLQRIRQKMVDNHSDVLLVTSLDEVAPLGQQAPLSP